MRQTGNTNSGQSLTELDDEALLQLLLRTDLPRALTDIYDREAHRRMATRDQQAVPVITTTMTTMNLPFLPGDELCPHSI